MKRVTLALAACASVAYGKTPMKRNFTDLACLLLAANVLPRNPRVSGQRAPSSASLDARAEQHHREALGKKRSRYRTSRLKVLIKYYSALLVRCIGFRQHANLLVFYPMLFSCQTSSLAVPQDRTTWVVEQIKLLKVRSHSRAFQLQAGSPACLFKSSSSDSVATTNR